MRTVAGAEFNVEQVGQENKQSNVSILEEDDDKPN
jgi:hypothetical protein